MPEGPRVFEAWSALHPHLVCTGCGEISHPEPEAGRRLFEVLGAGSGGFEVHELHVVCAAGAPAMGWEKSFRRIRRKEWEE